MSSYMMATSGVLTAVTEVRWLPILLPRLPYHIPQPPPPSVYTPGSCLFSHSLPPPPSPPPPPLIGSQAARLSGPQALRQQKWPISSH
ncbi:hypothetical protein BO70DRAFT_156189 [Aspergillus heteromorphus CBS 117.55]|uniref:Uncharacterized protein n=1 Tax=Aspergillus heteromorphus CBS 117.55 TaxID=1448321 RepID=A0A317V4Y7_9EURO|nr:uncharacterized protein BO70DRAFT_156189 [Aspergillus heteromorphus CBS 117.55]PWY67892.1 hypothetical protein BO70DRAFT_156189 [Aspergillus heteromorphus CBS 117.55]